MDDVVTWLKSLDLSLYDATCRNNQFDRSILDNDITDVMHLAALQVQKLHCQKLLRRINILRPE